MFTAPFVAKEFGLSDAEVAFVSGVISLGAFGAFALARLADRRGRRLVMRLGFAALGPLSLVTAAAPGVVDLRGVAARLRRVPRLARLGGERGDHRGLERPRARARRTAGSASWRRPRAAFRSASPRRSANGPSGWRILFAIVGALVLALPWVWGRVPETGRFEKSRAAGVEGHGRMRDLLAPAGAGARSASSRWACFAARGSARSAPTRSSTRWTTWRSRPWVASPCSAAAACSACSATRWARSCRSAGAAGRRRWPARCSRRWRASPTTRCRRASACGRRSASRSRFAGYVLGIQAFAVADRLVDTELFPTRLRGTYAGVRTIGDAAAAALQNFGLSAAIVALGSLERAIAVLVPALVLPSLALFWWVTTESRGLSLDEAAREQYPDPTEGAFMNTVLACLLIAVLLPYVLAFIGSYHKGKQFGKVDNNNPRVQSAQLTGVGARAVAAQQNAWEALAVFTASLAAAFFAGVERGLARAARADLRRGAHRARRLLPRGSRQRALRHLPRRHGGLPLDLREGDRGVRRAARRTPGDDRGGAAGRRGRAPAQSVVRIGSASLEALRRESPERWQRVKDILAAQRWIEDDALAGCLRAEFGASEALRSGVLLASDPPQRRLSFVLDGVRYEGLVEAPLPDAIPPGLGRGAARPVRPPPAPLTESELEKRYEIVE